MSHAFYDGFVLNTIFITDYRTTCNMLREQSQYDVGCTQELREYIKALRRAGSRVIYQYRTNHCICYFVSIYRYFHTR